GAGLGSVVSVLNPPAGAAAAIDLAKERSALIDAIVESDEALMEKYLSEGDIAADELAKALPGALAAGTVIPIFCSASRKDKDIGVPELLEALAKYAPSPKQGPKRKGVRGTGDKATDVVIEPQETGEFVAQVFKTLNDKFVGHMCYLRVFSGKVSAEQPLI